jgi:hypothetical protein
MRVLFCLAYPGYLRYYDSTIGLLAERGNEVNVIFEQPGKQPEGIKALPAHANIRLLDRFPPRSPVWTSIPAEVRRVADFARYLDPQLSHADYLRRRAVRVMHPSLIGLERVPVLPAPVHRGVTGVFQECERATPVLSGFRRFLQDLAPDVVFVSPVIIPSSRQPDLIKAAHALGIPTVMGVASWDHLSSKGILRVLPDFVTLWNDVQRREAESLHGVPRSRIALTGAQPWDRWFEREPSTTREEFCAKVGLRSDRRLVLFVGSTQSISMPTAELEFVREWIRALRASDNPTLRDVGVLIRPHPYNPGLWRDADLSEFGEAVVWPRDGANPVDEEDRAGYFDSLHHASAVVGINTSAMMEAAVARRPVLTVRSGRFTDSQAGTVHFNYLLPEHGGFVRVAQELDEHVAQLTHVIEQPDQVQTDIERFLRSFVRPQGLQRPSTPILVDAIEVAGLKGRQRESRMPVRRYPLRGALWAAGATGIVVGQRFMLTSGAMAACARIVGLAERGTAAIELGSHRLGAGLRAADRLTPGGHGPLERTGARVQKRGRRFAKRTRVRVHAANAGAQGRIKLVHNREKEKVRRRREARRLRSIQVRPGWSPDQPLPKGEVVEQ